MVYGSQFSTQGSKRSRQSTGSVGTKMSQFKRQRGAQLVPYSTIPRNIPLSGLPKTLPVRLKYVEMVPLNAGAGTPATYVFSANGMYDPNITGTGHQPKGFDQWLSLYRHYTVLSSKIKVTPASSGSTSSLIGFVYGVTLTSSTTDFSARNTEDMMESQNSRSYHYMNNFSSSANPTAPASCFSYFNAKREFGKNVMGSAEFHGDAASNPTEQMNYVVWQGDVAGNDPGSIDMIVELEFTAVLSERIPLVQS